ncbi:MAG: lytic murein transglycosylase B [Pseudomonadota bacterium]|nr:lytic murein transglycosylase B [Pseudomonadota bacterium]
MTRSPRFHECMVQVMIMVMCAGGAFIRPALAIDVHRPEVKTFIDEVSTKDSIGKRQLRKLLRSAKSQPAIIEAMNRPAEKAKPWYEYRPIFITERRIREGTDFWIAHRQELDRASVKSGVAPEYLAAIIGVETYYGRLTGSYRVLDALATLAFDYPERAKFFRDELEQFILLTRDTGLDPLTVKGSYAGAMGAPQFMPSNYRRYAVDADADGRIDLWNDWADVCASVGNYLKEHGWNAGEPVLSEAAAQAGKAVDLDGHKLALSDTVDSLKSKGVAFDSALPPDAPALLVAADEPEGVHWRVGYNNFFVITRYNHSALYAMAVYELAAAMKQRILMHDTPEAGAAAPAERPAATTPAGTTPGAAMPAATTPVTAAPVPTTSFRRAPAATMPAATMPAGTLAGGPEPNEMSRFGSRP